MMKFKVALYATQLLAGLLAVSGLIRADDIPAGDGKRPEVTDARALLEKGRASGALPEGMVVRLGACLGELDAKASKKGDPEQLRETWEFASNQVHRIVFEADKEQVESRPFDSKGICNDLLEGKAIEIQARKGKGPKVAFAGSPYRRGSRSLKVLWNGQTVLDLFETNGPFLDLYAKTDARAFSALYERLASQARMAFKSKAGEAK
jgi:hypothetical protein